MTNLEKENKNLKLASIISTLVAAVSIACFCLAANSSNKNSDALAAEQYDHAETISMWKISTDLAKEYQAKNAELLSQKNGGKVIEILSGNDGEKIERVSSLNIKNKVDDLNAWIQSKRFESVHKINYASTLSDSKPSLSNLHKVASLYQGAIDCIYMASAFLAEPVFVIPSSAFPYIIIFYIIMTCIGVPVLIGKRKVEVENAK